MVTNEALATAIRLDGTFNQKYKNVVVLLDRSHNFLFLNYLIEHEWLHKLRTEIAGKEASS